MQRKELMQLTRLSVIAMIFFLVSAAPAVEQKPGRANETLLAATSPFEDMVEFALAGNDAGVRRALAAADRQAAAVRAVLPAASAGRFDELLQAVHKAASGREHQVLAVSAVEVFRFLLDRLHPGTLKVPKEVSLLDYAGFRLKVLASAARPDWDAMRTTAEAASAWWSAVESSVTDKALRDAFSSTVAGLREAAKKENLPMLSLAVQIDLDLVDLLENHFERKQ